MCGVCYGYFGKLGEGLVDVNGMMVGLLNVN
jgi:hypothetical protein